MVVARLAMRFRRLWNWIRGKRIITTDAERGRVRIRTGHNSARRANGGQWYVLVYEVANGLPPLPRCCRGRLEDPKTTLCAERRSGDALARARLWYEFRHGVLPDGQDLDLVCVYEADPDEPRSQILGYGPNEVFEIEHPWLSSEYSGPALASYFGSWYGSGTLGEGDVMDFETFWMVERDASPLPRWGASWR